MPALDASTPKDRRPHPNLFKYYLVESLLLGPLFFFALVPRFLRFRTLRYHWDDQGITARWGALFHREISLDFERIQDIHLSSNLLERWLGLAKVQVQTASGSSKAEMTIEGLRDYKEIRDFLYARMRGVRHAEAAESRDPSGDPGGSVVGGEAVLALREAAAELRALRRQLAAQRENSGTRGGPMARRSEPPALPESGDR